MERYPVQNPEQEFHEVVGNLYLATSIREVIGSLESRARDVTQVYATARERRVKALLALSAAVAGCPAYIFIHAAKHGEQTPKARTLDVFDDTGHMQVEIHKRFAQPPGFNPRDIRRIWESDIVVLAYNDMRTGEDRFLLKHFFNGFVSNSRRRLGLLLMQPQLKLST